MYACMHVCMYVSLGHNLSISIARLAILAAKIPYRRLARRTGEAIDNINRAFGSRIPPYCGQVGGEQVGTSHLRMHLIM